MNTCNLCHKYGATIEFCGSYFHKRCYKKVAGILASELAKASTNGNKNTNGC
jgi:hypothetical protein